MKATINEIISADQALARISKNENIPIKTSYKILMLLNSLQSDVDFFYSKRRELFAKYGEQQDDNIVIPNDKIEEFTREINEIGDIESNVEFEKVDISLNLDIGVSAAEIQTLLPFFNFVD